MRADIVTATAHRRTAGCAAGIDCKRDHKTLVDLASIDAMNAAT